MTIQYYISTNRAGFMTLKVKEGEGGRVVMPLGLDVQLAHTAAIQFVNQLNNPAAKLCLDPEISSYLATKIPFQKHKDKTIAEVLKTHPDYLVWIYRTFDENHYKIGDVWKSLHQLANEKGLVFAKLLSVSAAERPRAEHKHLGVIGGQLSFSGTVNSCKKLDRDNGRDVYHVTMKNDDGDIVSFFSSGQLARLCSIATNLTVQQHISLSGTVDKHEIFNQTPQTKISKPKLVRPDCTAGLLVKFSHEHSITSDMATEVLSTYSPVKHDAIGSLVLTSVCEIRRRPGHSSELLTSAAFYTCELNVILTASEFKEILVEYGNTSSQPGLIGLSIEMATVLGAH